MILAGNKYSIFFFFLGLFLYWKNNENIESFWEKLEAKQLVLIMSLNMVNCEFYPVIYACKTLKFLFFYW